MNFLRLIFILLFLCFYAVCDWFVPRTLNDVKTSVPWHQILFIIAVLVVSYLSLLAVVDFAQLCSSFMNIFFLNNSSATVANISPLVASSSAVCDSPSVTPVATPTGTPKASPNRTSPLKPGASINSASPVFRLKQSPSPTMSSCLTYMSSGSATNTVSASSVAVVENKSYTAMSLFFSPVLEIVRPTSKGRLKRTLSTPITDTSNFVKLPKVLQVDSATTSAVYLSPSGTAAAVSSVDSSLLLERSSMLRHATDSSFGSADSRSAVDVSTSYFIRRNVDGDLSKHECISSWLSNVDVLTAKSLAGSASVKHSMAKSYPFDKALTMLGVDAGQYHVYVGNIRKWISWTILHELSGKIKDLNRQLRSQASCEDIQIGDTSLLALKQVATNRCMQLPALSTVLPYLDISCDIVYLVQRIHELASGGSLSQYLANGGGAYKGHAWDDRLVCDSEIVVHLLSIYMDAFHAPTAVAPAGPRRLSTKLLRTDPEHAAQPISELCPCIVKSATKPAHFVVSYDGSVYEPPKDDNNLFGAVVFLLILIDTKLNGYVGNISFGASGLNMLWVVKEKPTAN